jgi:hypothetical protein
MKKRRMLSERSIDDVQDIKCAAGSSHTLQTCKIDNFDFFLKWTDSSYTDGSIDPNLQILVEYIAYVVYAQYAGVKIPENFEVIVNRRTGKVGLATQKVSGEIARRAVDDFQLGKMVSKGVFVDILLANWDVIGMGKDNIMVSGEDAYRIDPGGALTFRAQGARKGKNFSDRAGELKTMLSPSSGAGQIFASSDLKVAASTFLSVGWNEIESAIMEKNKKIEEELYDSGMKETAANWNVELHEIVTKLKSRYEDVKNHAIWVLKN